MCIFIAHILKCVTECSTLLLYLTQLVLTYTEQPLAGDRRGHEHVCRDQVMLASPMLGRYTELAYTTHAQCMVYCIQYYEFIIKS